MCGEVTQNIVSLYKRFENLSKFQTFKFYYLWEVFYMIYYSKINRGQKDEKRSVWNTFGD